MTQYSNASMGMPNTQARPYTTLQKYGSLPAENDQDRMDKVMQFATMPQSSTNLRCSQESRSVTKRVVELNVVNEKA